MLTLYLCETQLDSKSSLIDHVALPLDNVDIHSSDDLKLTDKENKQWFGIAVSSNDISIATYTEFRNLREDVSLHGKLSIGSSSVVNYDINQI